VPCERSPKNRIESRAEERLLDPAFKVENGFDDPMKKPKEHCQSLFVALKNSGAGSTTHQFIGAAITARISTEFCLGSGIV
jgi:hypothetical protein